MGTRFRNYAPEQLHMLPVSPQDWLPPGHLAYQVRDLVQELDLGAIYRTHMKDSRGAPGFHPQMMVGVLLYAWANRVYSSRRIARLCREDLGGRYLAAGHQPDFRTISLFQLVHGDALAALFVQSVRLCQRAGMVSLVQVAIDGTKLEANASKHKAMSYGRMVEREAELRKEIAEIQRRAREQDAQEDTLFGKDAPGYDVPSELQRRETRLTRIRAAREALEAEAKAAALVAQAEREAKERERGKRPPGKKPKPPEDAKPKDKAQRNFTDPESRIMKAGSGAFIQGYNGQAVVDSDGQVIVACDLTNQAADAPHFVPMVEQVAENTGAVPVETLADAGYFSATNVEHNASPFSRTLIPPGKVQHHAVTEPDQAPPDQPGEPLKLTDRMRRLLWTPDAKAAYACRKKIVEPVFGQVKGCPGSPGFFHVLRRGLTKAGQEWSWACATHNFLKYLRYQCASSVPA